MEHLVSSSIIMEQGLALLLKALQHLKKRGLEEVYVKRETLNALKLKVKANEMAPFEGEVIHESITEASEPILKENVFLKESSSEFAVFHEPHHFELPKRDKVVQWNALRDRVLQCPECNRHVKPGKKVVFGIGNLDADLFFCGEAPGADEEIQGEPFVGKAGQLLTKIIEAMGLKRQDVYIGNIMNWRPEMPTSYGNRPPTQEEMMFCLPYLRAQVQIIKPKVIVALGATAVNGLLGVDPKRKMRDVRGEWFAFESIPLMITFHPSYLLRNNTNRSKRLVWEDCLKVMEKIKMPVSEKQKHFFLDR